MADYFFDTSALGKRYVQEIGSRWVERLVDPLAGHTILLSAIIRLEVQSVLARKYFQEKAIPYADYLIVRRSFITHVRQEYTILPFDQATLALSLRAIASPYQTPVGIRTLRSLDAIQLATAIQARNAGFNFTFVSADVRLLAAAQAEGFPTDDPTLHP